MKVIEVIPSISAGWGGSAYSVRQLSAALARIGNDVQIHALAPAPTAAEESYRVHAHPRWSFLSRLGISPSMLRALRREAEEVDVIHNHSLWMMPNMYPAWAARGKRCRLVTSPRGTLSAWALRRSAWKKRLVWFLGQGRAVQDSHCFHATAESEYQEFRSAGLCGPVAIIPNGIEVAPEVTRAENGPRRLLFLSTFHPKKGIDILLRAWSQIEPRFPEWELRIVGHEHESAPRYAAQMQELSTSLALKRVSFPGPAFGEQKAEEYRKAHLFVLPTHSENFGLVVAEALGWSIPVIVSKGAPWSGVEEKGCGWWIEQGVDPLVECLASALALPQARLNEKGQRGRLWMKQDFSWDRVGRMMHETYTWLVGSGQMPSWVVEK